jgi:hypothetical protein
LPAWGPAAARIRPLRNTRQGAAGEVVAFYEKAAQALQRNVAKDADPADAAADQHAKGRIGSDFRQKSRAVESRIGNLGPESLE